MKTDFEGIKYLLEKDLQKFLDDMKDTLIPMLDLGLDEKLKADLTRAIHGLKALSGMFELHATTEFITEVEMIVQKIFDLGRKDIANDLLNDLFEIKDQIEALFKDFILKDEVILSDSRKAQNKERVDEFGRHYVEYKMGKETIKDLQVQKIPESVKNTPDVAVTETKTPEVRDVEEKATAPAGRLDMEDDVLYVKNDVMYFSPKALKQEDVTKYQAKFVAMLANVKQIEINLGNTNRLDFTGIQFIQSIKKHCKVSGMKFAITEQSDLVVVEAGILGVEL